MARELIESGHSPSLVFRATGISKSSYHYKPVERDCRQRPLDPALVADIESLNGYELAYGYRKVTAHFERYNHKKVHRHMRRMGRGQPRRYKKRQPTHLPALCPIRPNVRWEADLTYVFDGTQSTYLFAVVDAHDKEIIGDHHGLRCRADEALESLARAVHSRFGANRIPDGQSIVVRVDQGTQYTADKFQRGAAALGITLEYCGINCPNEKPYIESFFAQYKREEVYRNEYRGFVDAVQGWRNYRSWYNSERIHQGLGWKTIVAFQANPQAQDSQLAA
jgi:putative transposase